MEFKKISKELANKHRCTICASNGYHRCNNISFAADEMAERVIEKAIQWFNQNLMMREINGCVGAESIIQAEFTNVEECIEDFKKFMNE